MPRFGRHAAVERLGRAVIFKIPERSGAGPALPARPALPERPVLPTGSGAVGVRGPECLDGRREAVCIEA